MKYGWLFVRPHCCSSSCSATTILTAFSSALTPIASPGPPGRIASARLPQWVARPSTWMRKYQLPAAIGETVNGCGIDVGSVTMAASAVNPASSTADVPSSCCIVSSPTTECRSRSPSSSTPASVSACATSHIAVSEPFMSVEPIP